MRALFMRAIACTALHLALALKPTALCSPRASAIAQKQGVVRLERKQGRGLTAASVRTTALLSTAWAARLVGSGRKR